MQKQQHPAGFIASLSGVSEPGLDWVAKLGTLPAATWGGPLLILITQAAQPLVSHWR